MLLPIKVLSSVNTHDFGRAVPATRHIHSANPPVKFASNHRISCQPSAAPVPGSPRIKRSTVARGVVWCGVGSWLCPVVCLAGLHGRARARPPAPHCLMKFAARLAAYLSVRLTRRGCTHGVAVCGASRQLDRMAVPCQLKKSELYHWTRCTDRRSNVLIVVGAVCYGSSAAALPTETECNARSFRPFGKHKSVRSGHRVNSSRCVD